MRRAGMLSLLGGLHLIGCGETASATTIGPGDVKAMLGPWFFVDDAVNGGGDATVNQPSVASYNRSFAGLLTAQQGPARVTFTGFGFAAHTDPLVNDASSLAVTFTYLGGDEAVGGGDDVVIGSATGNYQFSEGGEYAFAFGTPLTAELVITGVRFRIEVAPSNGTGDGSVRFKTGPLAYEAAAGPKFSVAGFVVPQRANLAKFQPVTVDSTNGQFLASYVTDGVTGAFNRWQSVSGSSPHWARVDFAYPVEIGSAHVFTGSDDTNPLTNFRIQYLSGESWLDAPGAVITGNTNVERNIIFTTPVTASSFRIHSGDGTLRIRELALYPPNGAGGFPLGIDLSLNLAHQRPTVANDRTPGNFALLATDGRVNKDSKWQTNTAGANFLEIDLIADFKTGSAHLYTGSPGVAPLADFVLKYWDGSAWRNIPGGSVTGNTTADLAVPFTTPVTTSKVRLEFTNPTNPCTASVRELCIFPANTGNTGYPTGTSVTGAPPLTAKADDYSDSFYRINNPAAGRFIAAGDNGQPALDAPGLTTAQGQYQILLNHSNGTYRLRNRSSGNCLSGARLSKSAGQPLTDAPYSALPHQDWILDPLDGGAFQLINSWSGLAVDIQGGGTAGATTPLVQNTANGSASQRWQAVISAGYPKKGIGGTTFGTSFNANWAYNWGLTNSSTLSAGAVFQPMQWGNFNWTYNTPDAATWKLEPAWRANSQPLHLMGFNEPDAFSQSGNSLDTGNTNEADFSATRSMEKAVELWPRLQAMDLPLVSPAAAYNIPNGWLDSFYTAADSLGYRVDYTAIHTYPGPSSGSSNGLSNTLQSAYDDWDRPVWLTEFSFVDWNRDQSWSEEDCYNCLAEFLWRAESLPWLRKYALFVFTEDASYPQPDTPWSTSVSTGGAPRSNARDSNGNLTAFGKLYAAWDNDATVRTDKTYYFHNKHTRKRLANNQSNIAARNIRIDGNPVHWTLVAAPAGRYHIVSSPDGRRLSTDGTTVSLAAAGTTGTAVEWSLAPSQHGWHYLGHPASSKRLQMAYNNTTFAATYSMVANTSTGDDVQWRFIVPPPPPVWSGVVSNSWTDAANWIPGVVPAAGDTITFDSASTANLGTMLDQDFDPSGISVSDPAGPVAIGGTHSLTVGAGGFDLSAASKNLTVNAPLVLSAAQDWNVATGRILNLDGGVSGAFQATVTGTGAVSLGAPVDPLVPLTIAAGGTLKTALSGVLASGTTAVTPTVGGTLDLNGTSQSVKTLGGSGTIDNSAAGAAQLTVGNNDTPVTLNTAVQDSGGDLALIKTGAGSLTLPSASTFAGGFTNNGSGNVVPQNGNAFGSGPVVMNGAALYATSASYTFGNALTLNGATLRVGGGNGRTIAWTGPVSITANSTIQCDGGTGGITLSGGVTVGGVTLSSAPSGTAVTISGPISGTGTVTPATFSNGTLNLNAANPFSGTYRAALGTLKIGDPNALQNGTLDMNAADSGTVNLNNLSATLGALTGSRNLALGSGTVSIGNNHANTTYSGVMSGSGSLRKTGNGTFTLSGPGSYAGATRLAGGTLALGANHVLPNNTAVILGEATLDTAIFSDTVGTLDVAATGAGIAFGSGAKLAFADSRAVDWTGGTLHLTGSPVFGPSGSLRFGTGPDALTDSQLARITATGAGPFDLDANGYLVEAAGGNTFSDWLAANAPATGFAIDSDQDGIPNGVENVLGSNPNGYNPGLSEVSATANSVTFRHSLNPALASDVSYGYQWSTQLGEWKKHDETDTGGTRATIVASPPDGNHVVTVVITVTGGPAAKVFGRLAASHIP